MAEVESSASRNARAGAQEGALKALDMNDATEGGTTVSRTSGGTTRTTKVVPLYQRTFVRPGKLLAPPIPAARHVMLAMTGSALIFFASGARFDDLLARMRREQVSKDKPVSETDAVFQTLMGWGVLLAILIFMADTGVAAPLAIGFSWLIFLTILLTFGEAAANNILNAMGQPNFGGAGGQVTSVNKSVPDTAIIPD